jgi:hypothetical protein
MRLWALFPALHLYRSDSARQHARRVGMRGLRHKPRHKYYDAHHGGIEAAENHHPVEIFLPLRGQFFRIFGTELVRTPHRCTLQAMYATSASVQNWTTATRPQVAGIRSDGRQPDQVPGIRRREAWPDYTQNLLMSVIAILRQLRQVSQFPSCRRYIPYNQNVNLTLRCVLACVATFVPGNVF